MKDDDRKYNKMIAKRRRRNIKRKFLLFLKILLIVVVFAGLIWGFNYLYNSRYFKISSIMVNGNSHYNDDEIIEVADVAIGVNIFEIDKKIIEEELEKKLIWLKGTVLKKVFPDKIEISVIERKPYVITDYDNSYCVIDDEGIVLDIFDKDGDSKYAGLLIVKNAIEYRPDIGEKIAKKSILSCGEIFRSLDEKIKANIKEAYVSDNFSGDIVFLTIDDKKIIFGNSDKILYKNEILVKIISQINDDEASFSTIDIRNIDNPVIE